MTTVHKPRLLHDAIKARLESETGRSVGKGKRPEEASAPYAVIYQTPTRDTQGGLDDMNEIRRQTFQVVYVGSGDNQGVGAVDEAQWMQEKCQEALLGWAPTVAGFSPGPVDLDNENLFSRTDHDGPTHEIADRYLVFMTPT